MILLYDFLVRHESLSTPNSDIVADIAEDSNQNISLETIPNESSRCMIYIIYSIL